MTIEAITKQVLLVIMDGLGSNPEDLKNAVKHANKPHIDEYFAKYPYLEMNASGELVGLPNGVMGNSEVGHLNLGAGRSIRQDLVRINEAIELNQLSNLPELKKLIEKTEEKSGRIHLMGLLSDGGVHSHINHIKALIHSISAQTQTPIFFHAFMDGRDTQKDNGINYLQELNELSDNFTLASIQGRSIALDRDRRWEKTQRAYETITGQVAPISITGSDYIQSQYERGIYDEFIEPALLTNDGAVKDNDSVFFINFRPDRARQLTLAFNQPEFSEFPLVHKLSYYLCMTPYLSEELPGLPVLFDKEKVANGLSENISKLGLRQYKSAETEKFAHVTYFFNGGAEKPFEGEERVLVQSPKDVKTYDENPQMSAFEVKDNLLKALDDDYSFYLVNFANPDMVGHTGNFDAAVKAVETVDQCLSEIVPKAISKGMAVILTADHGNCDQMIYPDGSPHTSHTTALVPVCLIHKSLEGEKLEAVNDINSRALKDIAPTVMKLLGLPKPEAFEGTSLY